MMRLTKLGSMMMMTVALLAAPATAGADGKSTPGDSSASRSSTGKKISVKRLVLAHGIDGHEPQDATMTFRAGNDRVYAFVEIENPGRVEGAVSVVFQPPSGAPLAEIPLKVGETARFRTWAFTRRAHDVGEWTVVIRDGRDRVLARQAFTVTK